MPNFLQMDSGIKHKLAPKSIRAFLNFLSAIVQVIVTNPLSLFFIGIFIPWRMQLHVFSQDDRVYICGVLFGDDVFHEYGIYWHLFQSFRKCNVYLNFLKHFQKLLKKIHVIFLFLSRRVREFDDWFRNFFFLLYMYYHYFFLFVLGLFDF